MTAEADIAAIADGGANPPERVRDALTAVLERADGTWANFTPTWFSTGTQPSIGDGTISGRWLSRETFVIVTYRLEYGSTTTSGTGSWSFSLPVQPSNIPDVDLRYIAGVGYAENRAVAGFMGHASIANFSGTFRFVPLDSNSNNQYQNNIPFNWGVDDYLTAQLIYEVG